MHAPNSQGDDLDSAFASLSLDGASDSGALSAPRAAIALVGGESVQTERELATIMQAMRKIREAIVASSRLDTFARDVYVFIIRATILTKHMESYHPALLHLLYRIHPAVALPASGLHEFLGYYILDLACRQADLGTAYVVRYRYGYSDTRVDWVLKALVHRNWSVFWRMRDEMDEHQKRLLQWADDRMRKHALECLGKSYLKADMAYIEKATHRAWQELKKKDNVGWELNGETVMIKRAQRR